jgi:SAM-dependent methyltransferase
MPTTLDPPTAPLRNAASFRDPSGFVFELDGRVLRAIDVPCYDIFIELRDAGLLDEWVDAGLVVGTTLVEDRTLLDRLRDLYPGQTRFLEHQRIEPISYPYEWSPRMLADAGVLTLDLQIRLLEHGYSLKDATAYNVQFVNGRPVFIDFPSIERPPRLDVWIALGQFGRMFTYPLLLNRSKGQSPRSYFLAHLNGASVDEVRQAFGRFEILRPGLLWDVAIPYWLGKRDQGNPKPPPSGANANATNAKANTNASATSAQGQIWNLKRLRAKLIRLGRPRAPRGVWADYTATCSYTDASERAKVDTIQRFMESRRPQMVLDVGCNTGSYASLAHACGADVVAIDSDHECVDELYGRVRESRASILPLCVDISSPSPAMGFRNQERPGFLARVKPDCVFALALIHHLHVSANLPVADIRDMFAEMTRRYLVLEFVPTDDVMFRRLMRFRRDLYAKFTLDHCVSAFRERFDLVDRVDLEGSTRTLLIWEKR